MKLKITITLDNAAFEEFPEPETVRILRELADRIENDRLPYNSAFVLIDENGNTVGNAELEN